MKAISPPMIITAILLIINAFSLVDHPVLMFFDLAAAVYLLWNSVVHIDPPSIGPKNFSTQG